MSVSSPKKSRATGQPGAAESTFGETAAEDQRSAVCPFAIAGVGASAGGLEALTQLFAELPGDVPMAFVIVQHLDPRHTSLTPEILARTCKMPVAEAADGAVVKPGHVFVMPSGADIGLENGRLRLLPRANPVHLPIDRFFRSLAEQQKSNAIGVVLSGTGSDGALGLEAIHAEGGITFAQSADSAKFDGMPRAAVATGVVDFVLRPSHIARELRRIVESSAAVSLFDDDARADDESREELLAHIFTLLREATGTDFSRYRRASILRRMARRLTLHRKGSLADYAEILEATPGEIRALFQELLVGVTSFFRDPQVFARLEQTVFPAMLKSHRGEAPIRIWVPGCSQGHEVYSIAMCLLDSMAAGTRKNVPVQIFGTDVSEEAIRMARTGTYIENIELDVPPERLRRYFVKTDGHYQVGRPIRDLCMFARHDVTKDPPFPNLDMVSCRNLLIYMEPALQHRIIPAFRLALKRNGILVLGKSETVGPYNDVFESIDKTHRLYRATGVLNVNRYLTVSRMRALSPGAPRREEMGVDAVPGGWDLQRHLERVLISEYAPPGVLVNEALEVIQYRGDTTPYLMPPSGQASQSLVKMAREGLLPSLRAAIREAQAAGRQIIKEGVRVRSEEGLREFALRIIPIKIDPAADGLLILFEEPHSREGAVGKPTPSAALASPDSSTEELKRELESLKEFLGTVIEDREAAHEELQSSNDQLLTSNEELQTMNEELESAKEELQSVNEELTTINEELQNRNAELVGINSDLQNVLHCANIPMLIFGRDLSLRRFTEQGGKVFGFSLADLGRPLARLDARLNVPGIEQMLLDVIDNLIPKEVDSQDPTNGRWHKVTIRPYRTEENNLDGAVATFTDIDLVKRGEVRYEQLFNRTFQAPHDGMLLVDAATGCILKANQRLMEMLGIATHELYGHEIWTIPFLNPLVESAADLKRFSETPYWHYEARWLTTNSGNRVQVDVISIVHLMKDGDTIQFALREIGGTEGVREELTRREVQVLTLLAAGNSTKQAAAALGIAFKTAVGHRSALMRKLGVHDAASMVRYAVRAGFVKP